ncbi:MAG: hypothetical protein ACI8QZ_002457 [Chlamydiales bacterium]|jgi:hypothetical protein
MLTILGLPLSRDFDGTVPDGVLRAGLQGDIEWVDAYPIAPVSAESTGLGKTSEDEEMLDALRTLGYVK